ncbi:MAG: Periplasmic thiol:disulfide interchange protein DsbA [Pedosphaera sp.]|nr:Periplasmic thiol:disulfide interchange protein DsbA [Pedosphaera sp.]
MKRDLITSIPSSKLTVPVADRDHIQGPIDAPMKLLEYGDYECPFCGATYPVVKAIQGNLRDDLCFAFRNFPLTNMHPHAEHAAEAAEAAGAQGSFWEMHDTLYENQDALEDEDLALYADDLGLDVARFIREVEIGAFKPRIREDFRSGVRAGVNGTPSFFVNGVRHDGSYDIDSLLAALSQTATARHA